MNRDPDPLRLYAILRSDLNMGAGKIAAQAGHAYLDSYLKCQSLDPERASEYFVYHGIKICLKARSLEELKLAYNFATERGLYAALITDAGYTLFNGVPTITAVGIGPARKSECDFVTKRFQLWRD